MELHDPTALVSQFRWVTRSGTTRSPESVPSKTAQTYQLAIDGMVSHTASYTLADLHAMPQTSVVGDFRCVTGWLVP
jgi:DMSO/TMAO reductase YedYZ molybdopterin-dependent catalytic subunit